MTALFVAIVYFCFCWVCSKNVSFCFRIWKINCHNVLVSTNGSPHLILLLKQTTVATSYFEQTGICEWTAEHWERWIGSIRSVFIPRQMKTLKIGNFLQFSVWESCRENSWTTGSGYGDDVEAWVLLNSPVYLFAFRGLEKHYLKSRMEYSWRVGNIFINANTSSPNRWLDQSRTCCVCILFA